MALPYVLRRENPLRTLGRYEPVHWWRFNPSPDEQTAFAWWCVSIFAYATVFSVGADALRLVLVLPFLALGLDIVRWCFRFDAGRAYFPLLRLLVLPFVLMWGVGIVVPLIAYQTSPPLWFAAVVFILAWRIIRVGEKIREHYLDYSLEHQGLSHATREKWKSCRSFGWRPCVEPSDPSIRFAPSFLQAVGGLRGGSMARMLLVGSAVVVSIVSMKVFSDLGETPYRARTGALVIGLAITCMPMLSTVLCLKDGEPIGVALRAVWHAVQVWCHSPPTVAPGARAAWSERSRYGDAENRRAYLVWNVVLITFVLLSAVVFYPLFSGSVDAESAPQYPIAGSGLLSRLLVLGADPNMTQMLLGAYLVATAFASPLFIVTGLLAIVGPTAKACRRLFEDDDALEHERGKGHTQ